MVVKLGLKLLELKQEYDSVERAIERAKTYEGIKNTKTLSSQRIKLRDQMEEVTGNIIRSMGLSKNVVHVKDSWYIIRYIDKQANTKIILDLIEPNDLYVVQRDGRNDRELQESEVNTLLPGIVAIGERKNYENVVAQRCEQLLYEVAGIVVDESPPPETVPVPIEHIMSNHAGERWIRRIMKVEGSDDYIKSYLKAHYEQVEDEVLGAASKAKLVWEDEEGIQYLFDDYNIMYVRGEMGKIITLYPVDFGFSFHINRTITLEQLEVIKACDKELQGVKEQLTKVEQDSKKELVDIEDEIKFYEAKINTLKSKAVGSAQRQSEATLKVNEARAKLEMQRNKIFKPNDLV
jgi:hypothetical protein